jgi:hypothetical protein
MLSPAAVASQPTIRDISCTNAFVSRAFAVLARNWESLAWRHGCVERWTLGGRECAIVKACEKTQQLVASGILREKGEGEDEEDFMKS